MTDVCVIKIFNPSAGLDVSLVVRLRSGGLALLNLWKLLLMAQCRDLRFILYIIRGTCEYKLRSVPKRIYEGLRLVDQGKCSHDVVSEQAVYGSQ